MQKLIILGHFSFCHYPSFWIPISTSLQHKYLTGQDAINNDCDFFTFHWRLPLKFFKKKKKT